MRFPRIARYLNRRLVAPRLQSPDTEPDFVIGKPGSPCLKRWFVIPRNR